MSDNSTDTNISTDPNDHIAPPVNHIPPVFIAIAIGVVLYLIFLKFKK